MADFYHGVSTRQVETSVSTPVEADSGVPFVVGTAPVHTVGGKVNVPILAYTYEEAVTALGFSDNWGDYTLCEMIYSHYRLYERAPVVFVNVLDPEKHRKQTAETNYPVKDGKVYLPLEAMKETVTVKGGADATAFTEGEDYELFYDGENLILEIVEGSAIPEDLGELSITFYSVDPSQVTKKEIIGGFDVNTKKYSGFELMDSVFAKYTIVADLLVCPKWSTDSEVAAIMSAKSGNINGVFEGKALVDADAETVRHYTDVPAWKKKANLFSKQQVVCWPMVKLGDRKFHLSVQMAGLMAKVDTDNGGCPAESPSNKLLQIDSAVLADGTEINLDPVQANYLNSNGVVTALNFIGGYVLWGNETACFPSNTDVKDYFIPVSRMFGWVSNSIVLSYWSKLDKKMTRRLIDSIVDSVNIWLNGLTAEEKLLGGRVEFRDSENSLTALMAGKAVFHLYITPPSPAKELEFVLEYDVSYVESALKAA